MQTPGVIFKIQIPHAARRPDTTQLWKVQNIVLLVIQFNDVTKMLPKCIMGHRRVFD